MVIDSAVILAILFNEPQAAKLLSSLQQARRKPITTPLARQATVTAMAQGRAKLLNRKVDPEDIELATALYDELLKAISCTEVMITSKISTSALTAAAVYGRMSGHAAQLSLEQCMTYATAKANNMPLLYSANQYAETDLA